MNVAKRSHAEVVRDDKAVSLLYSSVLDGQPVKRQRKSKDATVQYITDSPPVTARKPAPDDRDATVADTTMEEAHDNADARHDAPAVLSAPAASVSPAAVANSLTVVRANDMASNPHAPAATDVAARAAYLREVGTRKLSLTRNPPQAPNSSVRPLVLQLLYNRLFNGWSNAECRTAYTAGGGTAATDQAVSKSFLKYAAVWFEEQDVVIPWDARGSKEQKRLKSLGLGRENFPLVVSVPVVRATAPTPAPQNRPKPKKEVVMVQAAAEESLDVEKEEDEDRVVDSHEHSEEHMDMDMDMDDKESIVQQNLADDLEAQLQKSLAGDELEAIEGEEHKIRLSATVLPGHMLDRVRAAVNIFGKELAMLDPSASGDSVTLVQAALLEHCGANHDQYVTKDGYRQARPQTLRVLANAISPWPRNGLPAHDFNFQENTLDQGANSPDVLGVMHQEEVEATKIDWNVDSMVELYQLCAAMECAIVKDMIANKMRELYQAHVDQGTATEFIPPADFMDTLTHEDDQPFLRLLVDIMIEQNVDYSISYPEKMHTDVIKLLKQRALGGYHILHDYTTRPKLCAYHVHGTARKCYKLQTFFNESGTKHILKDFFTQLRADAAAIGSTLSGALRATAEADHKRGMITRDGKLAQQGRRNALVRRTQREEEKTAFALLRLEQLLRVIDKCHAEGQMFEQPKHKVAQKKLLSIIEKTQWEYHDDWAYFEKWCDSEDEWRSKWFSI